MPQSQSIRGSTLVQILVAAALGIGVTAAIAKLMTSTGRVKLRSVQGATLAELSSDVAAISKDIPRWLSVVRDPSAAATMDLVADCIPAGGASSVCPSTGDSLTDPVLTSKANGRPINSVNLVDLNGTQFAGTATTPIYFDSNGQTCPNGSDARCRFMSTGYLLRENGGSGDPGEVTFLVKIESNPALPTTPDAAPIKPLYLTIPVSKAWKSAVVTGGCAGGEITGFANDGSPLCYQSAACASGEIFLGWNTAPGTGTRICLSRVQNCPGGQAVTGFNADGTVTCGTPTNQGVWTAWSACQACGPSLTSTRSCIYPYNNPPWARVACVGANSNPCPATPPCACSGVAPGCWVAGPCNLTPGTCGLGTRNFVCNNPAANGGCVSPPGPQPCYATPCWQPSAGGGYYDGNNTVPGGNHYLPAIRPYGGFFACGNSPVPGGGVLVNFAHQICNQPGFSAGCYMNCAGWPTHLE